MSEGNRFPNDQHQRNSHVSSFDHNHNQTGSTLPQPALSSSLVYRTVSAAAPSSTPTTTDPTSARVTRESVVPSLMQVYESMIGGSLTAAATTTQTHHLQPCHGAESLTTNGSFKTTPLPSMVPNTWPGTSIPIPPMPAQLHKAPPPYTTTTTTNQWESSTVSASPDAVSVSQQQQQQQQPCPPPDTKQQQQPNPTRTVGRKRTLRETTLRPSTDDDMARATTPPTTTTRSTRTRRKSNASTTSSFDSSNVKTTKDKNAAAATTSKTNNDRRWSKRFTWPEELHRDFVSAIFDVGLKHSSPSTLLELMPQHEQITTERIKSHLQKYRVNRQKSKKEFMTQYHETVKQLQQKPTKATGAGGGGGGGGHMAGRLAYQSMNHDEDDDDEDDDDDNNNCSESNVTNKDEDPSTVAPGSVSISSSGDPIAAARTNNKTSAAHKHVVPPEEEKTVSQQPLLLPLPMEDYHKQEVVVPYVESSAVAVANKESHVETLLLPRLSDAEKQSPIGASMGYLMGLFFSLKQQLMAQRAAEAAAAAVQEAAVQAAYHSFVEQPQPPAAASTTASNPSTRTNLEENSLMKREMESQMVFQNKMRALKQQELEKYRQDSSFVGVAQQQQQEQQQQEQPLNHTSATSLPSSGEESNATSMPSAGTASVATSQQGAGEAAHSMMDETEQQQQNVVGSQRARGMSVGTAVDEFWNTDDDQLFEFLMSDG